MSFTNFFTTPSAMGGTKTPEKSNPLRIGEKVGHNIVDATLGTTGKYVADVLDPAAAGIVDLLSYFNPNAWRADGAKNIIKPISGLVSKELIATKNAVLGIVGGVQNIYKRGIQDSATDISSGTFDRVPYVGTTIGNVLKGAIAIPGLIPDAFTWLIKNGPDKLMDKVDRHISPTASYKPSPTRLRI